MNRLTLGKHPVIEVVKGARARSFRAAFMVSVVVDKRLIGRQQLAKHVLVPLQDTFDQVIGLANEQSGETIIIS